MTLNLKERFAFTVARRFLIPCLFLLPLFLSAGDWQKRTKAHDAAVERISAKFGLKNTFIQAMIWRESRFDSRATGEAGEIGLMQIMQDKAVTDWAKAHKRQVPSKGALYHPALNIEIGSWYLSRAVRRWSRYKDCYALALCEYNAGLTRANRWKPADPNGNVRSNISISSTLSYVNVILDRYEDYKTDWKIK